MREGRVRQAELELREKIVRRNKPLDAISLLASAVDDEDGRRPLRAEARPEPLELVGLLAHVNADRDEVFGDEVSHRGLRIHLGFQPSAAASHRRSGKVEQHALVLRLRVVERAVEIVRPGNLMNFGRHRFLRSRLFKQIAFRRKPTRGDLRASALL